MVHEYCYMMMYWKKNGYMNTVINDTCCMRLKEEGNWLTAQVLAIDIWKMIGQWTMWLRATSGIPAITYTYEKKVGQWTMWLRATSGIPATSVGQQWSKRTISTGTRNSPM